MTPERIEELLAHHDMVICGEASQALPSSAELLHLLRCAKAVAELERHGRAVRIGPLGGNRWMVATLACRVPYASGEGDLLTALESALEQARATEGESDE